VFMKLLSPISLLLAVAAICSLAEKPVAAAPASDRVTLTGWISCTTCFEPGACKSQTRWACTQEGVSHGASYVLVVGAKHYVLLGFEKELAKAAAESSVTITGDLTGNQLTVLSVDMPPKKHHEQ